MPTAFGWVCLSAGWPVPTQVSQGWARARLITPSQEVLPQHLLQLLKKPAPSLSSQPAQMPKGAGGTQFRDSSLPPPHFQEVPNQPGDIESAGLKGKATWAQQSALLKTGRPGLEAGRALSWVGEQRPEGKGSAPFSLAPFWGA